MTRKVFEGLGPGTLIPQRGKLPLNDPRLGAEEGFVLSRIDGATSLADVCLLVPFDEDVVALLLLKLWEFGAIELPGVPRPIPTRASRSDIPKIPAPTLTNRGDLNDDQVSRIDNLFAAIEELTPFELLGVGFEADSKEIKRAYFKMSKEFHPDRFYTLNLGDYEKRITSVFQAIKSAFELISDEKRKAAYLESIR